MRMRPILFALAALLAGGSAAQAARLACNGGTNQPNAELVAFTFDTAVPVSSTGGGGSVGKPSYSVLAQLPLDSSYDPIYSTAVAGRHLQSCVLTKTAGKALITITMEDVLFSDVKILSGPAYNNGSTGSVLELKLAFTKITVQTAL